MNTIISINKRFWHEKLTIDYIPQSDLDTIDLTGYEYVIISGGDGAIRRLVEYCALNRIALPKLLIDAEGTFNVLAKRYRLPRVHDILDAIAEDKTVSCMDKNYYSVNDTHFFIFSAGNSIDKVYIILADVFRVGFLQKSKFRYGLSMLFLLPLLVMLPLFMLHKKYFFVFDVFEKQLPSFLNIHFRPQKLRIRLASDYNIWQMDGDVVVVRSRKNSIKKAGTLAIVKGTE